MLIQQESEFLEVGSGLGDIAVELALHGADVALRFAGGDVMPTRVYIAVDWINLEGRLVAHLSGDETLQRWLDEELTGGCKVHARTAGLLYGIAPADAKAHRITLQGQDRTAYDGGKRLRHGWHYMMKPRKMAATFWVPLAEAERIDGVLTNAHPQIPKWWKELGDEVFGVARYVCPRCGERRLTLGDCEMCPRRVGGYVPRCQFAGWEREPARVYYTPFGRRRLYLGRRTDAMNALVAQGPQSCGASMWYRTLGRLHGRDVGGGTWPVPEGTLVFSGGYAVLRDRAHPTTIDTGTYDSFLVSTFAERVESVLQWIAWTVEQPWSELRMLRVPADFKIGPNWGEFDEQHNPRGGLRGHAYQPFSADRNSWRV